MKVVGPVTCSISPSGAVSKNSTVRLSVTKSTGTIGGASFSRCGFYNGDNCEGGCENNIATGNHDFTVTAPSKHRYSCQDIQNSTYKVCSFDVALTEPADISDAECKKLRQSAKAGDDLVIRPTVENCAGNCYYTITGDGANISGSGWTSGAAMIPFTHAKSNDSISYTLEVWNIYNSSHATCSFKVKYGNATSVLVEKGKYKSYTAGNTYELTLAGGSVFRCTFSTANAFTIGTFNGSTFSAAANSGGQATKPNPGEGSKVTFTVSNDDGGRLKCATDW
jgi:hypothetical protein